MRRPDEEAIALCLSNLLGQSIFVRRDLYIGSSHDSDPSSTKIIGYDHSKFVVAQQLAKEVPEWFDEMMEKNLTKMASLVKTEPKAEQACECNGGQCPI